MGKVVLCESLIKPQEIPVGSSAGDGSFYVVVSSTLFNDPVCDCRGFQFRGDCRHIREIEEGKCRFFRQPTEEELENGVQDRCPNCLNPLILYELDPEYDV